MDNSNVNKGFTLLEIIAAMVILSILAAVAIPRYISLDDSARQKAIDAGIAELNGRETLTWSNIKISEQGYEGDAILFPLVDTHLGTDYTWNPPGPDSGGGTLIFRNSSGAALVRSVSTTLQPGNWSR